MIGGGGVIITRAWGGGIKIPCLDQRDHDIKLSNLEGLRLVIIIIDCDYEPAPENLTNLRGSYVSIFNVVIG